MKIKAVIRPSARRSKDQVENDLYPVFVEILKKRKQARIATGFAVKLDQFDRATGTVIKSRKSTLYNQVIEKIMDQIEEIYFENKQLSARELKLAFVKEEQRQIEQARSMQFDTFASEYIQLKQGRDKAALSSFLNIVQGFDPEIRVDDWTIKRTDQFVAYLRNLPGRAPGSTYSENTVSKKLEYLRRFLNYAEANELITSKQNPFRKGYKIKAITSRDTKLDAEQMKAFKAKFGHTMYGRAFLLSFYLCGMRFSDVARLKWKNFDFKRGNLRYTMQKTGKKLELPITEKVRGLLTAIREDHPSTEGYVFPWLDGKDPSNPISSDSVNTRANQFLKDAGAQIGEPELTFHVARHTFTYLASPLLGEKGAQQLLNHASLDQTSGYIGRLKDSDLNPKINELHDLF